MVKRNCKLCKSEFVETSLNNCTQYCSDICQKKNRYIKRQLDRKNTKCKTCQIDLIFTRKLALKFCSDLCRSIDFNKRSILKFHMRQAKDYNLTLESYFKLLETKECVICGSSVGMCIDHCHKTGLVRGRLCMSCNTGLGKFKDDPEFLLKAIKYLKGDSFESQ